MWQWPTEKVSKPFQNQGTWNGKRAWECHFQWWNCLLQWLARGWEFSKPCASFVTTRNICWSFECSCLSFLWIRHWTLPMRACDVPAPLFFDGIPELMQTHTSLSGDISKCQVPSVEWLPGLTKAFQLEPWLLGYHPGSSPWGTCSGLSRLAKIWQFGLVFLCCVKRIQQCATKVDKIAAGKGFHQRNTCFKMGCRILFVLERRNSWESVHNAWRVAPRWCFVGLRTAIFPVGEGRGTADGSPVEDDARMYGRSLGTLWLDEVQRRRLDSVQWQSWFCLHHGTDIQWVPLTVHIASQSVPNNKTHKCRDQWVHAVKPRQLRLGLARLIMHYRHRMLLKPLQHDHVCGTNSARMCWWPGWGCQCAPPANDFHKFLQARCA